MRPLVALSVLACLLLSGCYDDRKPVPILTVRVMADGTFVLNREVMNEAKLRDEIQRVADENRRTIGTSARVHVEIATQAGASQAAKQMVVNTCIAAGINSIKQSAADE